MDNIKEIINKASEVYGNQTIVRALIAGIPLVGGSLDVLLSGEGNKYAIRRIETFIGALNEEISLLKNEEINRLYLNSEEWFDLIIKAFNCASKTRQQEKLRLFARIVKNSIVVGKDFEEDEPELYLKIVDELTPIEMRVAKCLYDLIDKNQKNDVNKNGANGIILSAEYPEFSSEELTSIFVRIERTGPIRELNGSYYGYEGGTYLINPLFKKFKTFIGSI